MELVDTIGLGCPRGVAVEIAECIDQTPVAIPPGDRVVLSTDGITEAEHIDGQHDGLERLCAVLSQHWAQPAEVIKERWWPMCDSTSVRITCMTTSPCVVVTQQEEETSPWHRYSAII